jgi:hypothetical protein
MKTNAGPKKINTFYVLKNLQAKKSYSANFESMRINNTLYLLVFKLNTLSNIVNAFFDNRPGR